MFGAPQSDRNERSPVVGGSPAMAAPRGVPVGSIRLISPRGSPKPEAGLMVTVRSRNGCVTLNLYTSTKSSLAGSRTPLQLTGRLMSVAVATVFPASAPAPQSFWAAGAEIVTKTGLE